MILSTFQPNVLVSSSPTSHSSEVVDADSSSPIPSHAGETGRGGSSIFDHISRHPWNRNTTPSSLVSADDSEEASASATPGGMTAYNRGAMDPRCPCPMVNARCDCKKATFMTTTPVPANTPYAKSRTRPGETLLFEDNFDRFDLRTWKHEISMGGMGNWEFQIYMNNRTNSFVKDGKLRIKPTLTSDRIGEDAVRSGHSEDIWGTQPASLCTGNAFYGCFRTSGAGGNVLNPIQSARLRTADSLTFKYGRVEFKAKLPRGDWIWPALWMMPRDNQYGEWPASGEIDIMESRGNGPDYPGKGINWVSSTLHWGPNWQANGYSKTDRSVQKSSGTFADDFHIYGMYWDENELYTYIDNENNKTLHVKFDEYKNFFERGGFGALGSANPWETSENPRSAPFDQEFFLIMNLAVGGTNFFKAEGPFKPWRNDDPNSVNKFYDAKKSWYPTWCPPDNPQGCELQVDSVHVWTLNK